MDSESESESDLDLESKLRSLISEIISLIDTLHSQFAQLILKTIHLVISTDMDSQPKPESEFMSVVSQTISVFKSMDLDSQPKPLSHLISIISRLILDKEPEPESDSVSESDSEPETTESVSEHESDSKPESEPESESEPEAEPERFTVSESYFLSVLKHTMRLEPKPELVSLIYQILSFVKWGKRISLCPQVEVTLGEGKFQVTKEIPRKTISRWHCLSVRCDVIGLTGEDATHFLCRGCNGNGHEEYENAPVEIKHPLHPKHPLQLVLLTWNGLTRECYCCHEDLKLVFYYCSACDFSINVACADEQPLLAIDHPKWHEHTLHWFPRQTSLTCNVCALSASGSSIYMCPPCDFVFHQRCAILPRLIKISRHQHRISFTFSFDKGDLFCDVCRKKIDNEYGGYSCIKEGCSYAAHSKCATQSNVWDGIELEGVPEEIEEELEPFVKISDGMIQHFSHEHHHLRLDENKDRDYDENKLCQICITTIYFGNFYSCTQCDFILHETCANLSRKLQHPIHPHRLTLTLVGDDDVTNDENACSACPWFFTDGFLYECKEEGCVFRLHVPCATIYEPLVHGSHKHPLYLTTKPGEQRTCTVCEEAHNYKETFNCIECDFSLCFLCGSIPSEVRYKHDKHILTLSYGKETSTMTYWCEICEKKVHQQERFYKCDKYCCVTIHMICMLGTDFYTKPDSSWLYYGQNVSVLPNNKHMSRPICAMCDERCPHKVVFQKSGLLFCTCNCVFGSFLYNL